MSKTSGLLFIALLSTLTVANNASQSEQDIITLMMTEREGAAHKTERISIGVSLPKDLVESTGELCLLMEGKAIACEMIPVNR